MKSFSRKLNLKTFSRKLQLPAGVQFRNPEEASRAKEKLSTGKYYLLGFTCTHDKDCRTPQEERRMFKPVSKNAYHNGVALAKCPCEKLHLIADNLNWFGEEKNIEEIIKARGEEVQKLSVEVDPKFSIS